MLRKRLRAAAAAQEGWALITAMVLMTVMLGSTLGLASYVDGQTQQTGKQRIRESSFNLAEAALNQQVWSLGREWPGKNYAPGNALGLQPYAPCTEASTSTRCPNPTQLKQFIPTPDADPGAKWTTQVMDNAAPYGNFYADALRQSGAPGYDANQDGLLWVRASAELKQRTRIVVALVRLQTQREESLIKAVVAGSINITNNGNKSLIVGEAADGIAVRCDVETSPGVCLGQPYNDKSFDKVDTQIQPFDLSKQDSFPIAAAMSDEAILRARTTAQQIGTWVQNCATLSTELAKLPAGKPVGLIFAEGGVCKIDDYINSTAANPVFIVNLTGTFEVGPGNPQFHGVLYAANRVSSTNLALQTTPRDVVTLQGTPVIWGGILVDGSGVVNVGSSGGASVAEGNLMFDKSAFGAITTIATAGVIQNTWRELPPR